MKERVICEITVVPIGTATPQVSSFVASVIDVLREAKDIEYQITAMGTIVQGPLDKVMELSVQMHEVPFAHGAQRVLTTLKIDDRRDRMGSMEEKVREIS